MTDKKSKTLPFFRVSVGILVAVLIALICACPALAGTPAKHVFLFIGDGMGAAQRNAAEIFLAGKREGDAVPREAQLVMNLLPVTGEIGTDSLSGVTDSAAAGTALATGRKTKNGAVATDGNGKKYKSVAAIAHENGYKIGIVTPTFLQDATPAAFYAHSDSRGRRYEIGLELASSGFEYFAGGGFSSPNGKDKKHKNLADIASSEGYRVTTTRAAFDSLAPGGKAIAINPRLQSAYMPWAIDARSGDISLGEFVKKGIDLLGGGSFFMMVEGGKIDLACHANDAASAIREVIAFDDALAVAVGFLREHPDDTLIVVTSDHETGGMTLSVTADDKAAFYGAMSRQKGSYSRFEGRMGQSASDGFEKSLAKARDFFGGGISGSESVRKAFAMTAMPRKNRPVKSAEYKKLYGPYDPFTAASMKEMNANAGVSWSTFYHTGKRVPVSAAGAGAEAFAGDYENSEIFTKLLEAMDLR
jgi:alkaline phosphatase